MCPSSPSAPGMRLTVQIEHKSNLTDIKVLPEDACALQVALCNFRNKISSTEIPGIILRAVTPEVWVQGRPGQAKITATVQIWVLGKKPYSSFETKSSKR